MTKNARRRVTGRRNIASPSFNVKRRAAIGGQVPMHRRATDAKRLLFLSMISEFQIRALSLQ